MLSSNSCMLILLIFFVTVYCSDSINTNDTTTILSTLPVIETTTTSNVIARNITNQGPILLENRNKRILVINKGILRGPKKNKKVDSLLYQEFDADGKKLVEYPMKNLRDVQTFFTTFLKTQICYGICHDDDE